VYRLPDALPLRAAALTEPLSCCLRGMDLLDIKQGERVALVGFGAIGCMMLQLIRAAGAGEIAVIEYNEAKRDLALELGADVFLCSKAQEEIAAYAEANSVDKVIECVGIAAAQETALAVAGKGATVVMFGVSDSAEKLPISLYDAFTKELTIKTSFINPHTTARAIRLLSAGILRTDKIIAAVLSPEEAVEEFKAPHYSKLGKTLVLMDPALENA
jgi:threonine dehydrogenase-like Zn-dependent dehydrogenase